MFEPPLGVNHLRSLTKSGFLALAAHCLTVSTKSVSTEQDSSNFATVIGYSADNGTVFLQIFKQ